jgi:hypothetical protein
MLFLLDICQVNEDPEALCARDSFDWPFSLRIKLVKMESHEKKQATRKEEG